MKKVTIMVKVSWGKWVYVDNFIAQKYREETTKTRGNSGEKLYCSELAAELKDFPEQGFT